MITLIILVSAIMLSLTLARMNAASGRRHRRRGIDWSGLKSANPPPENPVTQEDEDTVK